MSRFSTIRLRLWLPVFVFAAFTLLLLFSTLYQRNQMEHQLEERSLSTVRVRLESTQRHIDNLLRNGEISLLASEIADFGLTREVNALALLDSGGGILHATQLAWLGHPGQQLVPGFERERFLAAQRSRQADIRLADGGNRILAYQPVMLAAEPGEIRSTRTGMLVLDYDLAFDKAGIWRGLVRQSLAVWGASLLLMLTLQAALGFWLTRPLQHLMDVVHRFAAGDYAARAELDGKGELAELGAAWNRVREELADTLRQLEESRENLAVTLYSIGDAVIATDTGGCVTRMNAIAQTLTGWLQEDAAGRPLGEVFRIVNALTRQPADDPVQRVLDTGQVVGLANHTVLIAREGSEYQIADSAAPIRDRTGQVLGVVLVFRDVTEEYALRMEMAESEARFRAAFEQAAVGMAQIDTASGRFLRANRKYAEIIGYSQHEMLQLDIQTITHTDDLEIGQLNMERLKAGEVREFTMEKRCFRKDGGLVWTRLTVSPMWEPEAVPDYHIAVVQDITDRKLAETEIHNLAFYDTLTGLPNRRLLLDRLRHTLAASARHHNHGAILFIDLDNFKELNDTMGHDVGDMLLIEVGKRLQGCVRTEDTVARLGGDEFLVMLEDLSEEPDQAAAQAKATASKILAAINQPFRLRGREHHSSPSIGISLFRDHEITVDELLKRADTAMYQSKKSGRNTIRFYDPAMQAAMEARMALDTDLRRALPDQQFRLHYQTQVDRSSRILGAEVLLRWQHPERGLVSPLQFISLAEETGLIVPIGQWVLETACAQLKTWESVPHARHLQLAVNVSARQFRQIDFVEQVCAVLEKTAISPGNLKLELTESLVLDDIDDTITKMQALREVGVRFAMDDFGTGHSSLSYLTQLPLDQLKIDQSFVRNIGIKSSDAVIVQTIIGMANNLGMEVIAEGVETEQQRDFLERNGCPNYQGYLFGKPVSLEVFESLLKQ